MGAGILNSLHQSCTEGDCLTTQLDAAQLPEFNQPPDCQSQKVEKAMDDVQGYGLGELNQSVTSEASELKTLTLTTPPAKARGFS